MRRLHVNLDPNGVAVPAQRAALIASDVVAACLSTIAEGELSKPEIPGQFISYRINGPEVTSDERRQLYQNWLLAKGFQDLARGIRETLEEAIFYLTVLARKSGPTTREKFEREIGTIRERASKLRFPQLLDEVNAKLIARITFKQEFRSIQRVRNCLEHRGGIVGTQDVDDGDCALVLRFPRFKFFYMRKGEEIELARGEIVDAQDGEAEVQLLSRQTQRSKRYELGERITFTASEFGEIAMACNLFASDLVYRLPTIRPLTG
jgi:hypothetical protein